MWAGKKITLKLDVENKQLVIRATSDKNWRFTGVRSGLATRSG